MTDADTDAAADGRDAESASESEGGTDATIGVPLADSSGSTTPDDHAQADTDADTGAAVPGTVVSADDAAVASVYVPVGTAPDEWREYRLVPGEPLEVTVPGEDGQPVVAAYIQVDPDIDTATDSAQDSPAADTATEHGADR